MKLLLVEDDQAFAQSVQQLLETHHYSVDLADDGHMAEEMAAVFSYDLILLDWVLPKKTGLQVCVALREAGDRTPIILMTGKDSSSHEVAGLDAGADDYLVKPFGFEELLARIRAVLRRSEGFASPILEWGDLRLNPSSAEVSCRLPSGEHVPIAVTPKEYGLLEVFLRNPSRIFSMDALIDKVWPFDDAPTTGAIRTHIKGLRQKMRAVGLAEVIDTVYGLGYRLAPAIAVVVPNEKVVPNKKTEQKTEQKTGKKAEQKAEQAVALTSSMPSTALADTALTGTALTGTALTGTAPADTAPIIDIAALWQPVESTYRQRVATLSDVINGLSVGVPQHSDREKITAEAHALAGSLGSFGFSAATTACRQIEQVFQDHATLASQQLKEVRMAMTRVQQVLDTTELTTSVSSAKVSSANASLLTTANTHRNAEKAAPAAKLLIVDDDSAILTLLESILQDWGFQLQLLSDSQQFWETIEQFNPDMVLLDVEMPHVSGFELCQQLHEEPRYSELPILFLSAHTEAETIHKVFSIGADDYIRKPIIAAELIARVTSWLERARNRKLKAEVDPLTGVGNRYKSAQEMTRLVGLSKRYGQPFCLAVIDIDNFKQVNHEFGHAAGDRLLRQFGLCLRSVFRSEDVIGRWGGEEFVVGLYGVEQAEAHQYFKHLLEDWQQICATNDSITLPITFTTGMAVYPQAANDLQALYQVAYKVLQKAKVEGKTKFLAGVT